MALFLDENKKKRRYLPVDLSINTWADIETYFSKLESMDLDKLEQLEEFLAIRSELYSVLEEEVAWRYIKMNCDTANESFAEAFNYYVSEIEPKVSSFVNTLNKRLIEAPAFKDLDEDKFFILIRNLKKDLELFREENIPVIAELQQEEQEYGKIASEMIVKVEDKELTLQQAANYLKKTDRKLREQVYNLIWERRLKDTESLQKLLNELLKKRYKIAVNADFNNYLEFKFKQLGRFDYGIEECEAFHDAIAQEVCPLVDDIMSERKAKMGLDELKPWDLDVDPEGKEALKPFESSDEMLDKTISCFNRINPEFGEYIQKMRDGGYLDLDSRKGKAPGGFNYPLFESNVPFIYMNSTGNLRDLETMVHEGGHAIHSFLSGDWELVDFKEFPSEVAELASMSMELISMEHWDEFFDNEEDLKRAKRSQLQGVIQVLPWIACVDKFQHWLYKNPVHSVEERDAAWTSIHHEFSSSVIDWKGVEENFVYTWQKQLHIFEVPLYYVEYGIAQLGAIAMWKQYKEQPEQAIANYKKALSLGYTVSMDKIYEAAGIRFDFSKEYIQDLMTFVKEELAKI